MAVVKKGVNSLFIPLHLERIAHLSFAFFSTITLTLSTFQNTHIYRSTGQDHGAGGRPIGSLTTIHTNIPAITVTVLAIAFWNVIRFIVCLCLYIVIQLYDKIFSYTFGTTEVPIIWIYNKNKDSWKLGRKAPLPLFLPFRERSDLCHTCGIPMVPIVQICTQIPPIWISSIGYQLC